MLWANHRISDTTEMMWSKYAPLVTHHNHQVEKALDPLRTGSIAAPTATSTAAVWQEFVIHWD